MGTQSKLAKITPTKKSYSDLGRDPWGHLLLFLSVRDICTVKTLSTFLGTVGSSVLTRKTVFRRWEIEDACIDWMVRFLAKVCPNMKYCDFMAVEEGARSVIDMDIVLLRNLKHLKVDSCFVDGEGLMQLNLLTLDFGRDVIMYDLNDVLESQSNSLETLIVRSTENFLMYDMEDPPFSLKPKLKHLEVTYHHQDLYGEDDIVVAALLMKAPNLEVLKLLPGDNAGVRCVFARLPGGYNPVVLPHLIHLTCTKVYLPGLSQISSLFPKLLTINFSNFPLSQAAIESVCSLRNLREFTLRRSYSDLLWPPYEDISVPGFENLVYFRANASLFSANFYVFKKAMRTLVFNADTQPNDAGDLLAHRPVD